MLDKTITIFDKLINLVMIIFFLLLMLIGGYAFFDSYKVYDDTKLNDEIINLKPKVDENYNFEGLREINSDMEGWITIFETSIDYLYYNGYEIDGYADHVIYLRDVALINYLWDDVMLCFDNDDRLVNAQFVYSSSYDNTTRYRRVYNSLTRVYGAPITNDSRGISWYGGGCNGWITLSTFTNMGRHYMTLSIGY